MMHIVTYCKVTKHAVLCILMLIVVHAVNWFKDQDLLFIFKSKRMVLDTKFLMTNKIYMVDLISHPIDE